MIYQNTIEFHQRNCGFEKKYKRTFPWHEDDYGAVNFKVYTIIYYIRKDHTIKGGNLEYKFKNKNYIQQIKMDKYYALMEIYNIVRRYVWYRLS